MRKTINIHRPWAPKTKDLSIVDYMGNGEEILNRVRITAEFASGLEELSAKLLESSGKAKRACKEIHVLIEKGFKAKNEEKKKYANKIQQKMNSARRKVDDFTSDFKVLAAQQMPKDGKYWDGGYNTEITPEILGYVERDD